MFGRKLNRLLDAEGIKDEDGNTTKYCLQHRRHNCPGCGHVFTTYELDREVLYLLTGDTKFASKHGLTSKKLSALEQKCIEMLELLSYESGLAPTALR